MIKKEEGELTSNSTGVSLANKVRAFSPWPGAYMNWQKGILKIHRSHPILYQDYSGTLDRFPPGTKLAHLGFPAVATSDGLLILDEVQPAGKKTMPGKAFLAGNKNWILGSWLHNVKNFFITAR